MARLTIRLAILLLLAGTLPALAQHAPAGAAATHGRAPGAPAPAIGGMRRSISFEVGQRNIKAIGLGPRFAWIGSSAGVIKYDTHRGTYRVFDNTSGLLSNGVFHISQQGREIWVGTYGGGLSILDPDSETWRHYNIPHGMGDAFVYDALRLENGDVWIATWSGANLIRGGDLDDPAKWELFTVANTGGGLPNDWVYGLAAGKNGEVWMATEGGLARHVHGTWTNWTHKDGLGADLAAVEGAIAFDNDPGTRSSHHVRQKQEQGLGEVKVAYNPNYIVSLAVDATGAVWAGTWGAGLNRFDGTGWTTYTTADGLPGNHVFALHDDGAGRLWIGTNAGLARFDGTRFESFGRAEGLAVDSVFAIATAGEALWVGGFGGLTWFPKGIGRDGTDGKGEN